MRKHLLGLFSRQDGWKRFIKAGPITGVPFGSPAPDHRSCPGEWCNRGEAVVVTGKARLIKLSRRRAA